LKALEPRNPAPRPPVGADEVARLTPGVPSAATAAPNSGKPPPAPPATPPASPNVRTDETEPPTFQALSNWSRLTISRRGSPSRTLTREEANDLNLNTLLGSAAIAAVGPKPLVGAPEWKATLERSNGEVLAVFEVASTQVRWREGKTPPATGVPSGLALAGLREALAEAMQSPAAAAAQPPAAPPSPQPAPSARP
jgi:hypothetical protein